MSEPNYMPRGMGKTDARRRQQGAAMLTLKTDCVLLTQMEYDDLLASAKRQPCGVMGCHEDAGTKTARITKDDLTYVIDLCDRHWEDGDVTFKITAALGGVDLHGATPRGAARRRFRP